MKIQKKRLSAAIALILMLTITVGFVALPTAFGQFLPTARETDAWCSVSPNPEGKGQPVFIVG